MNKVFLFLGILFFSSISWVANAQNKVIFGGFSFGSILPKDTTTNTIFKENGGMLFINKLLVKKTKEISNESFLVDFSLLKDEASEKDQNIIVLALDNEYINDVNSIGLRIFAAYGPGEEKKQNLSSVINLFLNDVLKNEIPVIFGDGTQTRDFIYIDDVITAILNSAEISQQGIINVGSGNSISFNQIIEKIGIHTGKKINPQYVKKELSYVENLQADTQLMKSILNINPISIDSGITKFAKYLKII